MSTSLDIIRNIHIATIESILKHGITVSNVKYFLSKLDVFVRFFECDADHLDCLCSDSELRNRLQILNLAIYSSPFLFDERFSYEHQLHDLLDRLYALVRMNTITKDSLLSNHLIDNLSSDSISSENVLTQVSEALDELLSHIKEMNSYTHQTVKGSLPDQFATSFRKKADQKLTRLSEIVRKVAPDCDGIVEKIRDVGFANRNTNGDKPISFKSFAERISSRRERSF